VDSDAVRLLVGGLGRMTDNMPDTSRMVAIFRADLALPVGKLAAQAGHAFLSAWRAAALADHNYAQRYADGDQTKIVLQAADLTALLRIAAKAAQRDVPYVMITDAARTVLTEPTVTVLGLGPMSKTDCNALTRGLIML
jgi:peptidyl-tRNA hydrolase